MKPIIHTTRVPEYTYDFITFIKGVKATKKQEAEYENISVLANKNIESTKKNIDLVEEQIKLLYAFRSYECYGTADIMRYILEQNGYKVVYRKARE